MLTYNVVYTPALDNGYGAEEKGINFLCVDNKIHVRLRDYDEPTVIKGFINKLTYLITYLVNANRANSEGVDPNHFLDTFYHNDGDMKKVLETIKTALHEPKFAGISIAKAYRKKEKEAGLSENYGILGAGAAPTVDGYKLGDLTHFISTLNLSLYSFLFNDAFAIIIQEESPSDNIYSKYSGKENRKEKSKNLEYISLW